MTWKNPQSPNKKTTLPGWDRHILERICYHLMEWQLTLPDSPHSWVEWAPSIVRKPKIIHAKFIRKTLKPIQGFIHVTLVPVWFGLVLGFHSRSPSSCLVCSEGFVVGFWSWVKQWIADGFSFWKEYRRPRGRRRRRRSTGGSAGFWSWEKQDAFSYRKKGRKLRREEKGGGEGRRKYNGEAGFWEGNQEDSRAGSSEADAAFGSAYPYHHF